MDHKQLADEVTKLEAACTLYILNGPHVPDTATAFVKQFDEFMRNQFAPICNANSRYDDKLVQLANRLVVVADKFPALSALCYPATTKT